MVEDLPVRSVPYPFSAPSKNLTNSRAELPVEGLVHTTAYHSCEGLHKDQISTTRVHTVRSSLLEKNKLPN